MNFSKADLTDLKWSLGAFVLSLAFGGALISLSNTYLEHSLKDRQSSQQQLNEARGQLLAAKSDLENMSAYALEYNSLLEQKVIGDEQRLDWIEGLEKLRQQRGVIDLKYNIAPQQSYTPNPPLDAGNFKLSRSGMTMQIDLQHEEQLLQLFSDMRKQMSGWFMLDGCTLTRASDNRDASPVKAECTGGWFTMKNKSAP